MKRLLIFAVVAALALAGCGGGGQVPNTRLGANDINPQPRDKVRDGGTLRMEITEWPANFNDVQVDGASVDLDNMYTAIIPRLFTATADGGVAINHDYLTSAQITATAPDQVVTYTINPKAAWSDGTPITWRDFEAYWRANNGGDPAYQTANTAGYDQIRSVTRGADDKQAVITFAKPFGEWESLFTPLTPASLNSTPQAFNTGWRTTIPVTAGPFKVTSVDPGAQTITMDRDPKWWGTSAKLDRIVFRNYPAVAATPDALANNELDLYGIGGYIDLLRRAQQIPDAVVRNAPGRFAFNVTFNGAPGAPLADPRLRQAIAQGINRQEITKQMIGQVMPGATADGNHLYPPGSKEYRDNSGVLPFDPAHAAQALDSLGWGRQGATRVKDGKPLALRVVYGVDPTIESLAKVLQNQLAALGVTLTLQGVPPNEFFVNYINRGNFDLGLMGWRSDAFPFTSSAGVYQRPPGNNPRQNFGRIGTPQIDALIAQGLAELDDAKRAEIGNQVDRLLWEQAHSLILFAVPGIVAARKNLANIGARGFADYDYVNAGFLK